MLQYTEIPIADDDRPSNTLEHFTELDLVLDMIDKIQDTGSSGFEKDFEQYTEILTRYQEQPHLLDCHLNTLLGRLIQKIQATDQNKSLVHAAFKYLYIICKVRTYKAVVKFMPHELNDLEFALSLLEQQNPKEFNNWETRYILLLWLSILVLNPIHMSRLDGISDAHDNNASKTNSLADSTTKLKTKMERIFEICKLYTAANDTCSNVSAFLAAKFLTRPDIKDIFLEQFFEWIISNVNEEAPGSCKHGQLAAIAAILKHGKREDLLLYADRILEWILKTPYKDGSDFLKYKMYIKIIQRLGTVYLKPRIASWRYKRGTRSLALTLSKTNENDDCLSENVMKTTKTELQDENITIPDQIEDVIEELLQGLRSAGSDIRWSAAKGIGRVTNRLSREFADEVVGSVMSMLNDLEPHEAWHGACLALAELAKHGLLLLHRLKKLIPLLLQALFYDEMKGYMSVGQHIRDSACYLCWAFARAYNAEDLQPFVHEISAGLMTVATFDREINCRRAAAAAFQECVGRLGNCPRGIDISTTTDFYSVGLRQNAYLNVSDYVAQFVEYQKPLIDHLIERKINHWDTAIRELAAKALNKLTYHAPQYMANTILDQLITKCNSIDINIRHGSILAIGEIVLALSNAEKLKVAPETKDGNWLSEDILKRLNELMGNFLQRELFRGISGELMKMCCTDFIRNCSLSRVAISKSCLESWQQVIDKCLLNKNVTIRESATAAFAELCLAYYNTPHERNVQNANILHRYLENSKKCSEEYIRMGYVSAVGSMPIFMVTAHFDDILNVLIQHSLMPFRTTIQTEPVQEHDLPLTLNWSESRRDSIKSLSKIIETVGFNHSEINLSDRKYVMTILNCLLEALNEYTLDNRGDIGAWVREAAMNAIYKFITACPSHALEANYVHKIICGIMQQAVEKIDRTRGLAGRLLCQIVHHEPPIPYIRHHKRLQDVFPSETNTVLWLFADHTFPLLCSLLDLPDYSPALLLGLSASIGQLTESLIKYSSSAFLKFLRSSQSEIPRLAKEIVENFRSNLHNERITYPMLNFLDIVLASGVMESVLLDVNNDFAEDIYTLLNIEIKGHKKLYKLVSSISVFCHLMQVQRLSKKVLSKLSIFLGLTHVHIRKTAAAKLYEALLIHGDVCGIKEENMEEILDLLTDTDWGLPLYQIRPIRNELCILMSINVPLPTVGNVKTQ